MPTAATSRYTFRVLNTDGSVFGQGSFSHEGLPTQGGIAIPGGAGPMPTSFSYQDPLVGSLELKDVRGLSFSPESFSLELSNPDNTQVLKAEGASAGKPGTVSSHRGAEGDGSSQGRTLEFPRPDVSAPAANSAAAAPATASPTAAAPAAAAKPAAAAAPAAAATPAAAAPAAPAAARPAAASKPSASAKPDASVDPTAAGPTAADPAAADPTAEEQTPAVPLMDLVVIIDASKSMGDEAEGLSRAVGLAIEATRASCPSDLRVTYLGIEGTFERTFFDTTVRDYLTQHTGVDEETLRGRRYTWVAGGKVREDGARAIEDVVRNFDWRPEAQRSVFFLGDEGLEKGGKFDKRGVAAATRAIKAAQLESVRVHTYLGTTRLDAWEIEALKAEYARVAHETGGQAFLVQTSLNGFQSMFESVLCTCKPEEASPAAGEAPASPEAGTTSYTFRVLGADGALFGKGCFTHEGPPTDNPITHAAADGSKLTAFWYHDAIVGTRQLTDVRAFSFAPSGFSLELSTPDNTQGLTAGTASADKPGPVSRHLGAQGDHAPQGRTLEFPQPAPSATSPVEEEQTTPPAVDLVVVIDASKSMGDEAENLSNTMSAAIKAARERCPSDLRVTYLGIEGTFERTLFDTTIRDYLTQHTGVDEETLRGRRYTWVAGGKVREDGARAIEDVARNFDWRPEAQRALFFLGDEGLEAGGEISVRSINAASRAIQTAQEAGVRVHTYLGTTRARLRDALESEYARVARETGGQAFTAQRSLSGVQSMLESVICGSKSKPGTAPQEFCCCQAAVEDFSAPQPEPLAAPPAPVPEAPAPAPAPLTGTTSYTFRVLNADGSLFGKGCFTHEGPPTQASIAIPPIEGPQLTALWYHDPLVGTRQLADVRGFSFAPGQFSLELSSVDNTQGLKAGSAAADKPGPVSVHRGAEGDVANQGRTLEFPQPAPTTTTTTEEGALSVPAVDLVVVIDSSVSMKDEAKGLSKAVGAAIEAARNRCPSDLRVTYLGIEGTFKATRFEVTVRDYLTQKAKADGSALKGRLRGTVANGGAQEDGARAIEDVALLFDWRPEARRAVFFLGDEGFEGGDPVDADDIAAATRAIETARKAGVRVHTYVGTSSAKAEERKLLESEYARVASETQGQSFTAKDALGGFQELLEKVICGSKSDPRVTTQEYCCCQAAVEDLSVAPPKPAPAPAAPAPAASKVVIEKGSLRGLDKVLFATDKDNALAESLPILDQVVDVLKTSPDIKKLRIEAHTDNEGKASYNQELSARRAKWVRQYLIQKGIAAERLESAGFGITKPIDTNETPEGRANNRRVEFVIAE